MMFDLKLSSHQYLAVLCFKKLVFAVLFFHCSALSFWLHAELHAVLQSTEATLNDCVLKGAISLVLNYVLSHCYLSMSSTVDCN